MTAVSAPPREAPFRPADFHRLWGLARTWGATYRYRPAAAELDAALRQIEGARTDGPDFLDAFVYGNSIPELRSAALAEAEALWGEKADAAVEGVGTIHTASSARGSFNATVTVRCLNYAEISS